MIKKRQKLGKYLKEKRVARGVSQNEVAETLGYSTPQFVSNFERGTCAPPMKTLRALIDLYKIPRKEIYDVLLEIQVDELHSEIFGKTKKEKSARANR